MIHKRLIPTLLIQNGNLVKGSRFSDHKYVGDPINAVRIFNEKEVDELAFIDISATSLGREPDYSMIEDIASEAFMPIAYGGGIRNVQQVERLFRVGVEKIIINTEFAKNPEFIRECSKIVGSQSIVVAIDVRNSYWGRRHIYINNGTKRIDTDISEYVKKAQFFGAGEIFLTSIDREGTGDGPDLELIQTVTSLTNLPVIVHGGIGTLDHIKKVMVETAASAVAIGSFCTFHGKYKAVLLTYPSSEELNFLIYD